MSNLYLKTYKNLIRARKQDTMFGIKPNLKKNNLKNIRGSLINFLDSLYNLIKNPKLKYSDICLFVIDHKFIFPHKNYKMIIDDYGPTLTINTNGLLYEIFKAFDLENNFDYVYKLQDLISDLHFYLSNDNLKGADKIKKELLDLVSKIKKIVT